MPGGEVAAAPAGAGGQQAAPARPGGSLVGTILRMVLMWGVMSYMRGGGVNKQAIEKEPAKFSRPLFTKGAPVDFYAYVTEQAFVPGGVYDPAGLVWEEKGVALAAKGEARSTSITLTPSTAVQNNGSLYLHVVFARAGLPIDPRDPEYSEDAVFGRVFDLITYLPRPKNKTGVNLLSGEKPAAAAKAAADAPPREIISFFKPNVSIQAVDHFQVYAKNQIPPQVAAHLQYDAEGNYFPIVFFNEFWLLRDYLIPMNASVDAVTLHLDYSHVSLTWWQLLMQMDKSFESQKGMGLQQEGESDELKRVFLEGNPFLLALTMVVSALHTVFDMLAFKNDIGFWKNNKSMEGLSARSVVINAGCQFVIMLYLLDNETSMVVLISSVLGTAIEFWKVTKAMKVSVQSNFPYIKFEDRATYSASNTKQHDADAMRYLSYVLYPLVAGYAVYSLLYKTHKSWYSWIVNSLVGAVYMFGFILMCPQLYLNYKLKSVAHLPWRQMTYKFLNTIIDDLFAFVIKMPLLHRLSVFRDDVIFLIYLYQRWIYRVDMKRVNEFGFAGEPEPSEAQPVAEQPAALEGPAGGEQDKKQGSKRKDAAAAPAAAAADVAGGVVTNGTSSAADGEEVKKDK